MRKNWLLIIFSIITTISFFITTGFTINDYTNEYNNKI
jgi:hypothetical protein